MTCKKCTENAVERENEAFDAGYADALEEIVNYANQKLAAMAKKANLKRFKNLVSLTDEEYAKLPQLAAEERKESLEEARKTPKNG